MRKSLALTVAACLLVAALPAQAGAGSLVDARYAVQTMGVNVGQAALRLEQVAEGLAARLRFEVKALLGLVEGSDTRMENVSVLGREAPSPRRFDGVYAKADRTREIDMAYDAEGRVEQFRLTKRGRVRVDAVPAGLAPGVVDPMGAFLLARTWLDRAPEGAELALPIFDGRKRYDARLRYLGLTQAAYALGTAPAHRIGLSYRHVESMNEDTGVLEPERDGRLRELELAVSADGRYVPLRLDGSLDGMPVTAILLGDCAAPAGCPQ